MPFLLFLCLLATSGWAAEAPPNTVIPYSAKLETFTEYQDFYGKVSAVKKHPIVAYQAGTLTQKIPYIGRKVQKGQDLFSVEPTEFGFQAVTYKAPATGIFFSSLENQTLIRSGMELGFIVNPKELELEIQVAPEQRAQFKQGATLQSEAGWQATVSSVPFQVNPNNMTLTIGARIACAEKDCALPLLGSVAKVKIEKATFRGYRIPKRALMKDDVVFKIEADKIFSVPVEKKMVLDKDFIVVVPKTTKVPKDTPEPDQAAAVAQKTLVEEDRIVHFYSQYPEDQQTVTIETSKISQDGPQDAN